MGAHKQLRHSTLRRIALLAAAMALLVGAIYLAARAPLHNDFVEYWASARLLLTRGDPYSPPAILAVESESGFTGSRALLMWNPPWTLPFILPLGAISYPQASAAWLLLSLVIVFACTDFLWQFYGGEPRRRWLGWLLAATFFPLLTALGLGQIGPLILLGLTLFLRCETSRPWLAGAATVLIAVKPQLLYLFWIVLLLESLRRRRWKLLAGAGGALAVASFLPLLMTPELWREYTQLATSGEVLRNPSPNLGTLLRVALGGRVWLQFVPSLFGIMWAVLFWRSKRLGWTWAEHLPVLLLVSLVTTAYGWLFDQIVLLPALISIAVPLRRRRTRLCVGVIAVYCLASAAMVLFVVWRKTGMAYTWTAPVWLLIYLWIRWEMAHDESRTRARENAVSMGFSGSVR